MSSASANGFRPLRMVLPNGVTVLHQENPGSPSVTVSLHVAAGSAFETASTAGLAGFCAAMLKRGTERRTKEEIGETLDFRGALLSAGATRHTAGIGAKARAADLETIVELVAECAMLPTFPSDEVEKLRGDILTAVREDLDDTGQICMDALRETIYSADHPYAWRLTGTEETVGALARESLAEFHALRFDSRGAVVVVVGAVDADRAVEAVTGAFGPWSSNGADADRAGGLPAALPHIPNAPLPAPGLRAVQIMPDKAQADIAVGHPGMRRCDEDYYVATVMNMVLGRFAMGGRLGQVIREEKGMAYYAFSSLGAGVGPGPFVVRAGVRPDVVDTAIECVVEQIERMRTQPVGEQELADAKSAIVRSLPRTLETNEGIGSTLHAIEQHELGDDYLDRFPGLIESVTADQVLDVAARRLHPESCAVSIAGPYVGRDGTGHGETEASP